MSERKVRIGLVGCGVIGNMHLEIWAKQENVSIVAVCDIVPEKAQKAAEQYGAKAYTEMADMLAVEDLDAVDICTWSGIHAEQGIMAIEAGLHTLVEKPIDLDLDRIDKLIDLADQKNKLLACIFQYRFSPEIRRANELIKDGKLGKIISCSTYVKWWRSQAYYDADAWRGTWRYDGGVLSNQAIHSIDQLCWMAGPIAEVEFARVETAMHKMEAEDFATAVVRFESGATGVIEATTCAYPGFGQRTEIFGDKGSASFDSNKVVSFNINGEEIDLSSAKDDSEGDGRSDPKAIGLAGHEAQMVEFVNCILNGGKPTVDGREARIAVDALTKIYKKAGAPKLG